MLQSELPGEQKGRNVWYGPEVATRQQEWIFHFTPSELAELKVAADKLVASCPVDNVGDALSVGLLDDMNNFHLPLINSKIGEVRDELHDGLGFFVWRGIPVNVWSKQESAAAFLIISKCLGNLRHQDPHGTILGHVIDLGFSGANPKNRLHQITGRLSFHADSCDVVGLLCLKTAKRGGQSLLVSTGTIYNEMLKRNPELAHILFEPMATDRRGDVVPGKLPYYFIPVFTFHQGYLSAMYQRQYWESAQRFEDAPKLSPKQLEALDLFDALANDPKLNFGMDLEVGDIQFVHNHTIVHDRTNYDDWEDKNEKRHLLRVWLSTPGARPLPEVSAGRFGSTKIGERGGFSIPGVTSKAPLNYLHSY